MKEIDIFKKGNGKRLTQYDVVLAHLKKYGHLTQMGATRQYGITRLSAVILNLRKDGYIIETKYKTSTSRRFGWKNHYGDYIFKYEEREI